MPTTDTADMLPMPTPDTVPTDTDIPGMVDTGTSARGPLMPSPRLMPLPLLLLTVIFNMYKLLIVCSSVAAALAAPEADADAYYGYGYAPALLNSYPNWPGVSTPYSS